MEEQNQIFTSPIREYVAQRLQLSFDFDRNLEGTIQTFEVPKAEYEVRIAECYLTEKEAAKDSTTLNKSQQLRLNTRSSKSKPTGLFRSSSWFEVYHIRDNELAELECNEEVHAGNADETVDFLLKLDAEGKHFSYCNKNWFEEPEIFEGHAQKYRPLHNEEKNVLDFLIKEKIIQYYLT